MATYDEKWFAMNSDLPNLRLDVTQITNKEVIVEEISIFLVWDKGRMGGSIMNAQGQK